MVTAFAEVNGISDFCQILRLSVSSNEGVTRFVAYMRCNTAAESCQKLLFHKSSKNGNFNDHPVYGDYCIDVGNYISN